MAGVPFHLDGVFGGFGRCQGLVHDEGDHLLFEFQTRDAMFGVALTGVREVKVPVADLQSVRLTPGFLGSKIGSKIVVQAKRLATLKDIPGMTQGRVELGVAGRDLADVEKFVAGLHVPDEPAGDRPPSEEPTCRT